MGARRIFLGLFCLMYIFSVTGVFLYGGMISRDPNDSRSYLLENTDFAENEYWANNFNDVLSGLNVLFNLLIVNNWNNQANGMEAVTQSRHVRYFFVFFHIFGVVILSNLLVATLIDHFMDEFEKT